MAQSNIFQVSPGAFREGVDLIDVDHGRAIPVGRAYMRMNNKNTETPGIVDLMVNDRGHIQVAQSDQSNVAYGIVKVGSDRTHYHGVHGGGRLVRAFGPYRVIELAIGKTAKIFFDDGTGATVKAMRNGTFRYTELDQDEADLARIAQMPLVAKKGGAMMKLARAVLHNIAEQGGRIGREAQGALSFT